MNRDQEIDRLSLLESVLKDNFDLIRHADYKAQALLRINLAIFAAAFIGVPPTIMALNDFVDEGGWKLTLFFAVLVLYAVCAVCLLVSILKIVAVIRPRHGAGPEKESDLIFRSVARTGFEHLREVIKEISCEHAIEERTRQVFHSAVIAQRKFDEINRAISWMLGGGLVGVVFALILLISAGMI